LFCRGVPVSSTLWVHLHSSNSIRTMTRDQSHALELKVPWPETNLMLMNWRYHDQRPISCSWIEGAMTRDQSHALELKYHNSPSTIDHAHCKQSCL
jgi:hypothetical protein